MTTEVGEGQPFNFFGEFPELDEGVSFPDENDAFCFEDIADADAEVTGLDVIES